jgi:uncharacterized protein YndB with AHSA1/START domain
MSTPFRISHSFKVSRDTLWAVYTQPEHLSKWMGPQGFTMPAYDMEFRVGGAFLHALQAPDGTQMWGKWEFLGIDAPQRLSIIQGFSDAQGGMTRHPMSPTWPLRTMATTTLTEEGPDSSALNLECLPFEATPEEIATFDAGHESMAQGWSGTFKQLEAYLTSLA